MKNLINYIIEALKINSKSKVNQYNYQPKDKSELKELIKKLINERGNEADLNDIDTSEITDMEELFFKYESSSSADIFLKINPIYKFNGDISKWDVSNVINMKSMFELSKYTGENGGISEWDVKNVKTMYHMFYRSNFNGDINKWNPQSVKKNWYMFNDSPLEKNKPKWYTAKN